MQWMHICLRNAYSLYSRRPVVVVPAILILRRFYWEWNLKIINS